MAAHRYRPTARRPQQRAITTASLLVVALAGACSTSSKITPLGAETTSDTTSAAPATTSTTTAAPTTATAVTSDAAIIAADQAEAANFLDVARTNPVNPADLRIGQLAAGQQLTNERSSLTVLFRNHQHDVGTITTTGYRVVQHVGTSAVVVFCALDMTSVVDDTTGRVVTAATNSRTLDNDRLDLVKGRWMVTDAGIRSKTC